MGRKGVLDKNAALYGRAVLAAFLMLILAGCGAALLNGNKSEVSSVIWKHRDQYVQIESQDRGKTAPLPNDHPALLSAEHLLDMLGALEVQFEDEEKPVSLFTFKELEILAPAISQGLAEAGTRQDVTFAIVGIHRPLVSFSHDRAVITGRLFVREGRVNLILGKLHEEHKAGEDRRISPLLPGSRLTSSPLPQWGKPWTVVAMQGLEIKTDRHDWLMLTPDPKLWKAAIAQKKEAKETATAALFEASQVREESAQLEVEQQELRTEVQELKQAIEQMKQAPAPGVAAPAPVAAPAAVAPAAPAGLDQIEQRLEILQRLKAKGLISDEEFRAKKQEILDSI